MKKKIKKQSKGIKKNKNIQGKTCKQHYKEVFSFIKENRNYVYFALFAFVLFFIIGLAIPASAEIVEVIRGIIEQMIARTSGLTTNELIGYIFFNNLLVSFIAIVFGFIFGIIPFLLSVANGYILGYVCKLTISAEGLASLWKLLPYGIFELIAIFLSLGFGFSLGMTIFHKNPEAGFKRKIIMIVKTFFLLIIPLLLIAAIIEGVLIGLLG